MFTGYVLAAGFGTRLKPLSDHIPKALTPLCGKPVLARTLAMLQSFGVERIGVNSHYFHEQMDAFGKTSPVPFLLFHETPKISGTGGALYFARDFLSRDEFFCVINVDIVAHVDLRALFAMANALYCDAGLVAVPVAEKGSIWYDPHTKEYAGSNAEGAVFGMQAAEFIGMTFYRRSFLQYLSDEDFSIVPVWKRARENGACVKVLELPRSIYWKDCGTPSSLAQLYFDVIDGKCKLDIPSDMTIDSQRKIAFPKSFHHINTAHWGEHVWVESPLAVAKNTRLEHCIVMKDAPVPKRPFIKKSLLSPWGEIPFE